MQKYQTRREGQLLFFGTGLIKAIPVFWKLERGELDHNKTWVVSVSFSEDFGISLDISKSIFDALLDTSITLKFRTEGFESDCVIFDILNFADTNVIDIGSPDLPMSRMAIVRPENK